MALVDVAQRLLDSIKTIRLCRLVIPRPVDVDTAHINIRNTIHHPIRDGPSDAGPRQDAYAIQPGRDEVPLYLGSFAYEWRQIRCERLRPAK